MNIDDKIKIAKLCQSIAAFMKDDSERICGTDDNQWNRLDLACRRFLDVLEEMNPEQPKIKKRP